MYPMLSSRRSTLSTTFLVRKGSHVSLNKIVGHYTVNEKSRNFLSSADCVVDPQSELPTALEQTARHKLSKMSGSSC